MTSLSTTARASTLAPDAMDRARQLQKGVLPALWIPTDPQGRFLADDFKRTMNFARTHGVHGWMVLGTTGEFPHLEPEFRKQVLKTALENSGGLPVMANISDIRPRVVAELGRYAREAGAAAVSLLPPYYFRLEADDQVEFFVRSIEASGLPGYLYNFPERTGNRVSLETIARVADRVPMLGIKQSGAEMSYHQDLLQLGREKNFVVITGGDTHMPALIPHGVSGVVSGLCNGVPDLVVSVYHLLVQGKTAEAAENAERLKTLDKLMGKIEFPLNIQALMEARGTGTGSPKMLVSSQSLARVEALKNECRNLFQSWGLPQP